MKERAFEDYRRSTKEQMPGVRRLVRQYCNYDGGECIALDDETVQELQRAVCPRLQAGEVLPDLQRDPKSEDGRREAPEELCKDFFHNSKRTAGGAVPSTVAGRGSHTSRSSFRKRVAQSLAVGKKNMYQCLW